MIKYRITTKHIISSEISNLAGIKIFFNDHPITELTQTTVKFTNCGNQTIEPFYYASKEPLCIHIPGHLYQHSASAENNNSMPAITPMDNSRYKIDFDFLKPKQSFTIELFHDGNIDVSGELKTGNITNLTFFSSFSGVHFYRSCESYESLQYHRSRHRSTLPLIVVNLLLPVCVLGAITYLLCTVNPFLFGSIGIICGMLITNSLLFVKKVTSLYGIHKVPLKKDRSR